MGRRPRNPCIPQTHTRPVAQAWGQTRMTEDRCAWLTSMAMKHMDLSLRVGGGGGSDPVPGSASPTSSVITAIISLWVLSQESGDPSLLCLDAQNVVPRAVLLRSWFWELQIMMINKGKGHDFFLCFFYICLAYAGRAQVLELHPSEILLLITQFPHLYTREWSSVSRGPWSLGKFYCF